MVMTQQRKRCPGAPSWPLKCLKHSGLHVCDCVTSLRHALCQRDVSGFDGEASGGSVIGPIAVLLMEPTVQMKTGGGFFCSHLATKEAHLAVVAA